MEYSRDMLLEISRLKEDEKNVKKEKHTINGLKSNNKILKFMNEHKFITSISITCLTLMLLDCVLVYNFIELLQKL